MGSLSGRFQDKAQEGDDPFVCIAPDSISDTQSIGKKYEVTRMPGVDNWRIEVFYVAGMYESESLTGDPVVIWKSDEGVDISENLSATQVLREIASGADDKGMLGEKRLGDLNTYLGFDFFFRLPATRPLPASYGNNPDTGFASLKAS